MNSSEDTSESDGFEEHGLLVETPRPDAVVAGGTLSLRGLAEGGADPVIVVRLRVNGAHLGGLKVRRPGDDAGAPAGFGAEIDMSALGSRLDLRLTGLRRSGATAPVRLLTAWRPVLRPARDRIAPLSVTFDHAGGRVFGRTCGPDMPEAVVAWRRGAATVFSLDPEGRFDGALDAGDGAAHLWAQFGSGRPDAYVGPLGDGPPTGVLDVAFEVERGAPVLRAETGSGLGSRIASWLGRSPQVYVNGRRARLRGSAGGRFELSGDGWTLPDRVDVEALAADGRFGRDAGWNLTGLPIRAFMAASAADRALRVADAAGRESVLRVRRVNPSGGDMVFVVEDEPGRYRAAPLSGIARVAVADDVVFTSDPAERPPPAMAAFLKALPQPGYGLKSADDAFGSVVLPSGPLRAPPREIRRVVLVRPGANATDDIYVLKPLAGLLSERGLALEIADLSGSPWPDEPLGDGAVVIVSRNADDAWLDRLAREKPFTVYLMDDDPPAAADSPGVPQRYRARMIEACRSDFQAMLRLCDRFVAASPGLARRYASPKTVLLAPAFIREPAGLGHFGDGGPIRIAYHGTDVHRDDIAFVYGALARVLTAAQRVRFQVVSTIRPPKALEALPNFERVPPMPWADYVSFARANPVHLNLAPMLDTPFNRAKSIIKLLDTASLGAAGLFSRVAPFDAAVTDGVDGFLVENDPEAWETALTRLIADRDALRDVAEACLATSRRIGALGTATQTWREMLGL